MGWFKGLVEWGGGRGGKGCRGRVGWGGGDEIINYKNYRIHLSFFIIAFSSCI